MDERIEQLQSQNEILKAQLMNTSLINELAKVMHSSTDLGGIIRTIQLGIQEITEFDRVILFAIDKSTFSLRPKSWVGFSKTDNLSFSIPLGFEGGEITDSIFLNRHLVVDKPDLDTDIFATRYKSDAYLVIPLVSKVTRSCWDVKECKNMLCPAREAFNPYCWSIMGTGENTGSLSENERRHRCVNCPSFKVEGVFWMDSNIRKAPVSSDDITTLTTILNQAGILIENFRIFNELEIANNGLQGAIKQLKFVNHELRDAQAKINKDLEHARSIQLGLMPQDLQDTDTFSISTIYIPADAVGGDYYDVFAISPGLYGIVVADVSGHGVSSALIMSMGKVLLKTFASPELGPQKTLEKINETFLSEIRTDNFVTIFYAVLDTNAHTFRYSSAGHCPILFLNKKTIACTQIKADGLFLGVFPDMMLNEGVMNYEQGVNRVVLYTDGLTEAKNPRDEMFELERLENASLKTIQESPKKALAKILDTQQTFCSTQKQQYADDITLLVMDF
jgi:serine phosphatase RsbU (regulator of sigma subunit)